MKRANIFRLRQKLEQEGARYRGLFYSPECSQIMNADIVGVLNIAR